MPRQNEYAGVAALAICESLMLAMNDHDVLPEAEIVGVLRDAEETHLNAMGKGADDVMHQGVADLIQKIIAGGNSVRRT
jgi:hypothetical protein